MKRFLVLVTLLASLLVHQNAFADSDTCGSGAQSAISESTQNISGDYDVYVKLSLPGQNGTISAYTITDSCHSLGDGSVNGNTWTKVGTAEFTPGAQVSFEIDGDIPGDNEAAAKPQLLLVPLSMPCLPRVTCDTTIGTASAYLSPIALTTSSSGLMLGKIVDPASDTVQRVDYYTNGQFMYSLKDLQPFNSAYVDYYQQTIARVIVYGSGQRAVLQDTAPMYADNMFNFALRSYARYSTMIITTSIIVIVLACIITIRSIARRIEQKNYYNYAHGLGQHTLSPFEKKIQATMQNHILRSASSLVLIVGGLIIAIIATSSFVVSPYKVDGTSMYATFHNGQILAVNKLPVTLNKQFNPTRGEVVIFHPNYGNVVYSDLRVDNLLVKRIVGLPGERITSAEGKLVVYNSAHPYGYYLEDTEPWGNKVTLQKEDATFDITLGNDQIFVAGDNRPDSIDSRINGALPLSEVVGVVVGY